MKILRSVPSADDWPAGRAYVQDDLERFVTPIRFDYQGLAAYGDDILLLEWDIAVSSLDLGLFAQRVKGGEWPVVAPFLARDSSHYLHWTKAEPSVPGMKWEDVQGWRPIRKGEPECYLFGFGMAYLPAWVLRSYPPGYGGSSILSDGSLPRWLQAEHGPRPVPVDWSITTVHLA